MFRRAFSVVELLVVIAIVAVLITLLLVALGAVRNRAKIAGTQGVMTSFSGACETFKLDHGYYPGVLPDPVLAYNNHQAAHEAPVDAISGTENALLQLMGGYEEVDGPGANVLEFLAPSGPVYVRFDATAFGQGATIDGKPYGPYLSSVDAIRVADHGGPNEFPQWPHASGGDGGGDDDLTFGGGVRLPDLVDAWGTPILYARQSRRDGPLAGDAHVYNAFAPQFYIDVAWPYVRASSQIWLSPESGGGGRGSLLSSDHPGTNGNVLPPHLSPKGFAQTLRHAALQPPGDLADPELPGWPRGAFVLMSAGADGIFLSGVDGPGTVDNPIGSSGYAYDDFLREGIEVIDQFDDIRVFGGVFE